MTILTVAEISKEYDIPRHTLYSAIREGRLPTLKRSGHTILLEREAVENFVKDYEQRHPARPALCPEDKGLRASGQQEDNDVHH